MDSQESIHLTSNTPHWPSISSILLADFSSIPEQEDQLTHRIITPEVISPAHPWAYFDGLAQERGCGGGAILHLSESHFYKIKMGLGRGTNNFAELLALKLVLCWLIHLDILMV